MQETKHLTDQAMKQRGQKYHFTEVLNSGDIIAHDDTLGWAITWKKRSTGFNVWSYGSGNFVKVNYFQTMEKPDRTRTAVAIAKRHLKDARKEQQR